MPSLPPEGNPSMLARLRARLTYANVMATLAVFLVLGGGAYAALELPRNVVKSRNIKNGQVKRQDLVNPAAVKSAGLLSNDFTEACQGISDQWVSTVNDLNGPVGYYRDVDGIVHLTGEALRCGNPPSGDTIFTLPAGYRPPVVENFSAFRYAGGTGPAEMVILRDGSVGPLFSGSAAGTDISLDGVSFRCGPSGKNGCP
jgi:hypothetical protein